MLTLTERAWQKFSIKDIFHMENRKKLQTPTGANVPKEHLFFGTTPRITATSFNNGVDGYYTSCHANYRTYNNFISVSFLGTIFYHPYEASLDMKVHCLQLKNRTLNRYLSMFLISEIKKSIADASYGNQLSSTDLPHKHIMLPVDNSGCPDYAFMEAYAKEKESNKLQQYIAYAQAELMKMHSDVDVEAARMTWREFLVSDLFDIYHGKRLVKTQRIPGDTPMCTAKATNNGVAEFIGNDSETFKQCITVDMFGNTFFHKETVTGDDNIYFFVNDKMSAESKQFIATAIKKAIAGKYSYGCQFRQPDAEALKIKLPVDSNGDIDYKYMEAYIYIYISMKLQKYLDYINATT